MNNSGDRLKALLQECDLTPSDFAAQRDVSPQHINNWFKRGVPVARLEEIADLFCVHRRWLKSGEGPKHPDPILRPRPVTPTPPRPASLLLSSDGAQRHWPLQRWQYGEFKTLEDCRVSVPQQALEALGILARDVLCLAMPADNMAPVIPRDSILAIDRSCTQVVEGETYALLHGDQLRIHCLSLGHKDVLSLHSHDRLHHPSERYSPAQRQAQDLRILGWVFWYTHLRPQHPTRSSVGS